MKTESVIVIGAALVGAYLIWRAYQPAPNAARAALTPAQVQNMNGVLSGATPVGFV